MMLAPLLYHAFISTTLGGLTMNLIYKERKLIVNLEEIYSKYNIKQAELSRLTAIDHARLSELEHQKKQSIYKNHIEKIAEALDIDDISEILSLERVSSSEE